MPKNINFLIIDDSNEDCFLIIKRLKSLNMELNVQSFSGAEAAYNYIIASEDTLEVAEAKNIIILDIYMPLMDGFQFAEEFEKLPAHIQDKYVICALTSSINKNYTDRISTYTSVKYFLEKPIKTENLITLIES